MRWDSPDQTGRIMLPISLLLFVMCVSVYYTSPLAAEGFPTKEVLIGTSIAGFIYTICAFGEPEKYFNVLDFLWHMIGISTLFTGMFILGNHGK